MQSAAPVRPGKHARNGGNCSMSSYLVRRPARRGQTARGDRQQARKWDFVFHHRSASQRSALQNIIDPAFRDRLDPLIAPLDQIGSVLSWRPTMNSGRVGDAALCTAIAARARSQDAGASAIRRTGPRQGFERWLSIPESGARHPACGWDVRHRAVLDLSTKYPQPIARSSTLRHALAAANIMKARTAPTS